ncbi:MAG: hypothetical protein ACUVS2_05575 [Candidatus Flexifilum sp.]
MVSTDEARAGDAGSALADRPDRHGRPPRPMQWAGGRAADTKQFHTTTDRSGANAIMNDYVHQHIHRHRARSYEREAQAQRLHAELRRSQARRARSALRRFAQLASLFL